METTKSLKSQTPGDACVIDTDSAECPAGFIAAGGACGIKKTGASDLAVIVAAEPVPTAALFTRNLFRAAPVDLSANRLRATRGMSRAILISSGCANAATGEEGIRRAKACTHQLASILRCDDESILMNSTGVIGEQLPDHKIVAALPEFIQGARAAGLADAARAIMTTDTLPKMVQVRCTHQNRAFSVAGIAKGSGMIHPNMATMIGVLLTDAKLDSAALDQALRAATDRSFHRISVDGDTSTNDSVFAMASGHAGEFPVELVQQAMTAAARELALKIVRDGEGARKLIHVRVHGAKNASEALQVAQTVAGSMLVRTAVAGGDPNWGRIVAAAGRSGVQLNTRRLRVTANDVPLFANGAPLDTPLRDQQNAFAQQNVVLDLDLGEGDGFDEFFTCDLTEGYVQINSHYRT